MTAPVAREALDGPGGFAALHGYEHALTATSADWWARDEAGDAAPLAVGRWLGEATAAEEDLLDRVRGPVLDVGCGPGRHLAALARRGVAALGLDVSGAAVALARRRGGRALNVDVVRGPLPGAGAWGGVLLLDGNVGIGGDAVGLLRRLRPLLTPGGAVWAELDPPARRSGPVRMRLEGPAGASRWFGWARVGAAGVEPVAAAAGLAVGELWCEDARWFARLDP